MVGDRAELMINSGVQSGMGIFRARALGASWPRYGLCLGGQGPVGRCKVSGTVAKGFQDDGGHVQKNVNIGHSQRRHESSLIPWRKRFFPTMNSETANTSCCAPVRAGGRPSGYAQVVRECGADRSERATIPGGRGLIGTVRPELAVDGEAPLRERRIESFEMDVACVTNERFQRFVDATGYVTEAERLGDSFVFVHLLPMDTPPSRAVVGVPWWRVIEGATWRDPLGPRLHAAHLPEHPVTHVSWNDAQAFAKWADGQLPTEAEWEHAARGGLGDVRFPWGDTEPNDTDFFPCNIWQGAFPDANLGLDGYLATAPARSFEPNGYGLYNMVGNVWEYTSQPFRVKSLKKAVKKAHADKAGYKLSKGGSFLCHISYCYRYRIAARTGTSPDSTTSHQGFRLVYK